MEPGARPRCPIKSFSYPYGQRDDCNAATGHILAQAGYEIAVTTHWGTWQPPQDLLKLRRMWFHETDEDHVILKEVDGHAEWVAAKEDLGYACRTIVRRVRSAVPRSARR